MLSLSNGEWAEASGEGGLADGSRACEYVLCIRTLQGSSGPALAGPRVLQHFLGRERGGGGMGGDVPGSEHSHGLRATAQVRQRWWLCANESCVDSSGVLCSQQGRMHASERHTRRSTRVVLFSSSGEPQCCSKLPKLHATPWSPSLKEQGPTEGNGDCATLRVMGHF